MNRRTMIKAGVSLLALTSSLRTAWAMPHGSTQGMGAGHNMMMGHGQSSSLMPMDAMPSGHPLQALPVLKNTSTEAKMFKAELTAVPKKLTVAGRKQTELWLYNGELPGPQIVVYEGDTVEILFKNKLPQPTTVHWHGLPVPADQDGNPQDPVPAGGERYYRFTLPVGSAGTYWYHPHPHGHVSEQVSKGLAGTFIVKAKADPLANLKEQHWLFSDLRLDADGSVSKNTMMDWMNGREGEFVMINGQYQPTVSVAGNQRIRIWNACTARYLKLAIPGCQWILLGTDGGLIEAPLNAVDHIFLAPAERVEVVLLAQEARQTELINQYYDRQKMMVEEAPHDMVLAQVKVSANPAPDLPQVLREIPDLGSPVAYKKVEFSEAEMSGDNHAMSMDMMNAMFMVNGKVFDMDRIDLESKQGVVEEWEIFNNSHMDHPFHLHGTQFMVASRASNGVRQQEPYKAWRDTVNLRPYETVRFKVVHHSPGLRMFHCHILEHENLGMMANLLVT